MKTEFVIFHLNLAEARESWRQVVEERLQAQGEPLRWAITQIDETTQTATIEAVVIQAARNAL